MLFFIEKVLMYIKKMHATYVKWQNLYNSLK